MGPQQTTAFLEVIKRLTAHPVLVLSDWNQPFTRHIDASTLATGEVLTQDLDGGRRHGPVGYHSKRLSRAQRDASANDREVLNVMNAVEHFEIYLQRRSRESLTAKPRYQAIPGKRCRRRNQQGHCWTGYLCSNWRRRWSHYNRWTRSSPSLEH